MSEPLRHDDWIIEDEDPETAARLDAEAIAEADEKGWISGEAVILWLRSLGTDAPLPPPQSGD